MIVGVGGDQGCVGYSVAVPGSYSLTPAGGAITLFIYTHVREDALDLYGFATRAEKDLFLALLSVTGIGPKGALGILSGGAPSEIFQAILGRDKDFLTRIPGIGKKTAERVVLELADSLRKKVDAGTLALPAGASRKSSASGASAFESPAIRDATAALVGLGYREADVATLLAKLDPALRAEDLVKTALRQLG